MYVRLLSLSPPPPSPLSSFVKLFLSLSSSLQLSLSLALLLSLSLSPKKENMHQKHTKYLMIWTKEIEALLSNLKENRRLDSLLAFPLVFSWFWGFLLKRTTTIIIPINYFSSIC